MSQKVNIKKLNPNACIPTYGTEFSAGADLYSGMSEAVTVMPGTTEFIKTGIAMEIPTGLVGLIYARSGMACKKGLAPANKVGVIDEAYESCWYLHCYSCFDEFSCAWHNCYGFGHS